MVKNSGFEDRIDTRTLTCVMKLFSAFIENTLLACNYPIDSALEQTLSDTGLDPEHDIYTRCANVLSRMGVMGLIVEVALPSRGDGSTLLV